ncbi:MAG: TIGR04086 family membrane protein [Clostridiales bacterium]|nr:TIGR04086 family membrane protein [Clostridiales bacterium]MDY5513459.1 TIGR04086 family membrane protein [Candidatus Ventricola sp.]
MEKQTANPSFIPRRERGLDSFRRSMRRGLRRGRGKSPLMAALRGVLVAASVTVLGVAVFALLLNWWNASDRAVTAINQVVKFVSILAGVTSAMRGGESGGVLRGASVGLLYMALGIVCYSLLMGESPRLTAYLADLGMGLAAGGLFGMILSTRKAA